MNTIKSFFTKNEANLLIHISRFPRDAIAVIRKFIAKLDSGASVRIYAVGGDGILFDCLNAVAGLPNVELGVIPYGKTNDFIRAFGEGLNSEFRNIEKQLNSGHIVTDVIYAGNNYAINSCTIGMESYAVHKAVSFHKQFTPILNSLPGSLSSICYSFLYFLGGVFSINNRVIINQHYQVTIDNKDYSGNYAIINIANGPCYGGDMCSTVAAIPNDGLMDIILFKSTNIFNFISKGYDYLYGKFYKYPDLISYHRAKEIVVRSELPLVLQLDGEVFIDTNITIKIIPQHVKIISINDLQFNQRARLEDLPS
jgi:diacylglycerol kinase family enzyme